MMQVYIDAIQASKIGNTQYVLQKSLNVFRTDDERLVLYCLNDGYDIKAKCHNGALESSWLVSTSSDSLCDILVGNAVLEVLGIKKNWRSVYISTLEYFDDLYNSEHLSMFVDVWEADNNKPETYRITMNNRNVRDLYRLGQKKAREILEILTNYSVKQYKDNIVTYLSKSLSAR